MSTTDNNATYKVVNGVTYFKLRSEFEGDYTKNCGLLGEEIDQNFYFLRGNDIKTIEVDENRNLIIKRVDEDYEPLVVNIGEELGQPTFALDRENGELKITYPDGTVSAVTGFLVAGKGVRMATDSTLQGDGTMYSPLGLSPIAKTGTYAPADKYVDITNTGIMPEGQGKGYRIVTKEKIDEFGKLYPYSAVETIQRALEACQSEWRIPTKSEWDDLLNAFECDKNYQNHKSTNSTYLGKEAGRALKSAGVYHMQMGDGDGLWKEYQVAPTEDPVYGEDIAGIALLPLGHVPERNDIMQDLDNDAEGFGKYGEFWTRTEDEDGEVYTKIFAYNNGKVKQAKMDKTAKLSIRLIKDYFKEDIGGYNNYNAIENILGLPYPTELVYSPYEGNDYVKIWTSINVYDSASNLNGVDSQHWSAVTDSDCGVKEVFFINEWDGVAWHKKPMNNGDSVVIKEFEESGITRPYHEWRMINDVLIDTADALVIEFDGKIRDIHERIDNLSASTKAFSGAVVTEIARIDGLIEGEVEERIAADLVLSGNIMTEEAARIESDETLQSNIDAEASARTAADEILQNNITAEENERKNVDSILSGNIITEAETRSSSDIVLQTNINNEEAARIAADIALGERIDEEASARTAADIALGERIDIEASARTAADEILQDNINAEKEARQIADNALSGRIDNEIANRIANDITTGEYTIKANETMTLPTNGTEIPDVKIKVDDDFFNFGTF